MHMDEVWGNLSFFFMPCRSRKNAHSLCVKLTQSYFEKDFKNLFRHYHQKPVVVTAQAPQRRLQRVTALSLTSCGITLEESESHRELLYMQRSFHHYLQETHTHTHFFRVFSCGYKHMLLCLRGVSVLQAAAAVMVFSCNGNAEIYLHNGSLYTSATVPWQQDKNNVVWFTSLAYSIRFWSGKLAQKRNRDCRAGELWDWEHTHCKIALLRKLHQGDIINNPCQGIY